MTQDVYRISKSIREKFKVFPLKPEDLSRLTNVGLEHFSYLKEVSSINFSIFFRVNMELLEFITPANFSHELVERIIVARDKDYQNLDICVRGLDYPKFQNLVDSVRSKKITTLLEKDPLLDRKTMQIFGNLSGASQMIVRGGISANVAQQAKKSASQLIDNLMESHVAIGTLSRMVLADATLYDHSASVAMLAGIIGKNLMGLSKDDAERCARGGLYHDVGKTCVPNNILNKPGKFTPEEFEIMKTHTTLGYEELLRAIENGAPIEEEVAIVTLEHHERFCGGGYPVGKSGRREERVEGISLYARVVTIADVYSALLMKRVYKEAYDQNQTLDIMRSNADRDYDPVIWKKFEKSVDRSNVHYKELESRPVDTSKGRIFFMDEDGFRSSNSIKKNKSS